MPSLHLPDCVVTVFLACPIKKCARAFATDPREVQGRLIAMAGAPDASHASVEVDAAKTHHRRRGIQLLLLYRWRNKYGVMDVADARRLKDLESENAKFKRLVAEQMRVIDGLKEFGRKIMITPSGRRAALGHLTRRGVSQRKACRYLGLSRRVACYGLKATWQGSRHRSAVDQGIAGRVAVWLSPHGGVAVVERIARAPVVALAGIEHSTPPAPATLIGQRHPIAGRGATQCGVELRLRARPARGRTRAQAACVIDEYTRECLAIEVGASLRSQDVILTLSRLMRIYGKPAYVRFDNGAEFTAAK